MISAVENEVGLDGALHPTVLQQQRIESGRPSTFGFMHVSLMREQRLEHLLGAFVAQIGSAQHQQRRDQPGREKTQRQCGRQQDQQLVAHRACGNPAHNGQFAIGGKAGDIVRRHGRIVDHRAGSLQPRLGGLPGNIVDRGRRHLGERRHIVQQAQ